MSTENIIPRCSFFFSFFFLRRAKMAVHAQFYSENSGLPIRFPDWAGTSQVLGMENGLLLSLPQPSQPQFQQLQAHQNSSFDCNQGPSFSFACDSFPSTSFPQALNAQLELQRHEIDRMLVSQNERLRQALQHQRKEQVAFLLSAMESKSQRLIRQKEDDLTHAKKKSKELEDCLRKAEMESEAWQRLAKEKEAMVLSLTNTLEQARERGVWDNSNRAEDTESCCGPCEESQNREEEEQKVEKQRRRMACKSCNSRSSRVLFLPCRHLCCCYFCEALLDFCPVCNSAKEGCMEVLLA